MSSQQPGNVDGDTATQVFRNLDQACDRFELAWIAGEKPRIEDYIASMDEPFRSRLLRELVALEVSYRRHNGETPDCAEYETRFTGDTSTVREGFECRSAEELAFGDLETQPLTRSDTPSGSLEIRCPSCRTPMQVAVDTSLTELTCSSCGTHFSLVDQSENTHQAPPLSELGRFELVERLGVGGFGSVWKAHDKELDRTVAVKIPRRGSMTTEEQERFFHEARAAAQLSHPSIVSVHEVGRDGDSVYIVSDFVRGVTLGDWLTGQQLTSREAAELCLKIAKALHHAHEAGVIHRDLKPSNIMIDGEIEPHLMDFGLARRDVDEVTVTLDGQVLGTPAYMSPEQAQGEAHYADRRSDVYSLGVVLFQLLTGELPFRGNPRMLMHQVINEEPPSPRKLNANVSKDLETITLKCLEKDPPKRYQSAAEVADELRCWLDGEPIRARPLGPITKIVRWAKRKPVAALLAATVIGVAIVGPLVAARQQKLLHARDAAIQSALLARADAEGQRKNVEETLVKEEMAHKRTEEITDFALAMLQSPSQGLEGPEPQDLSVTDLFQQAAERIRNQFSEQPAIATRLLFALATSLHGLGEYQTSAHLAQECAEFSRSAHGSDSEATLMAERLHANCLYALGQHNEALRSFEELVSRAEAVLGMRHPAHLVLCADLASIYAEKQQIQAIDWIEKALPHYSTVLSEEHPDRRFIANRAGWVYCMFGRYEIGLKYFEEALSLRRKYDGRLAHATLRVQHAQVAWALTELGRYNEAISNQQEALALFQEKYPDQPVRWLWPLSYLVHRYNRAGQLDSAIEAADERLRICSDHDVNPMKFYSWTTWDLHDLLLDAGRSEDAMGLWERFSKSIKQVLGNEHPSVFAAEIRHLRKASDHFPREYVVGRLRLLLNHPEDSSDNEVLAALAGKTSQQSLSAEQSNNLAVILSNLNRSDLAIRLFQSAVDTDPLNTDYRYHAAIAALGEGDLELYRSACQDMLEHFKDTRDVTVAERIGYACVPGPYAVTDLSRVVRLAHRTYDMWHGAPRLVGAALYRAGEYEKALKEFNKASDAGYEFAAWDHAFVAMSLHKLQRHTEAEQTLIKAKELAGNYHTWHERVEVESLIQEAEELLKSSPRASTSNQ